MAGEAGSPLRGSQGEFALALGRSVDLRVLPSVLLPCCRPSRWRGDPSARGLAVPGMRGGLQSLPGRCHALSRALGSGSSAAHSAHRPTSGTGRREEPLRGGGCPVSRPAAESEAKPSGVASWWSVRLPVAVCRGWPPALIRGDKTTVPLSFPAAGKPGRLSASADTERGRGVDSFHVQSVLNSEGFFFLPFIFSFPLLIGGCLGEFMLMSFCVPKREPVPLLPLQTPAYKNICF